VFSGLGGLTVERWPSQGVSEVGELASSASRAGCSPGWAGWPLNAGRTGGLRARRAGCWTLAAQGVLRTERAAVERWPRREIAGLGGQAV